MAIFSIVYREDSGAESTELMVLPSPDEARMQGLLRAHLRQSSLEIAGVTASVSVLDGGRASEIGRWMCLGGAGWIWVEAGRRQDLDGSRGPLEPEL